jgi:hypothetical protein
MQWMIDAQIPRNRRKMYMGHSASDVSDLYEKAEITSYIRRDRRKLLRFLKASLARPSISGELVPQKST